MAKKDSAPKPVLERTYVIPLRRETLKVPKYKKAKKAVKVIRDFIVKHMKATEVKISKTLNETVWKDGIKNPPGKVKVTTAKDDKGVVMVELFGVKPKEEKVDSKKKDAKKIDDSTKKADVSKETKADSKKVDEKKADVKPEAKVKKAAEQPKEEKKADKPSTQEEPKKEEKDSKKEEEKPAEKKETTGSEGTSDKKE